MQLRLLSLFSGIGAFEKALALNDMDYELVNYCEIDKYAAKAYSVIHNVSEDLNLKDVRTVDTTTLKDIDLITYGFPCVDISRAGKQKGFVDDDGNVTRSGLFFEALRIIIDTQPKIAIAENVKALTTKKFADEFGVVLHGLDNAGYNNYWSVLNAKDYGIPQNRERVFIVSVRKDIDNGSFSFPMPITLDKRLKDVLEKDVDERFYLKDTKDFFIKNSLDMEDKGNGFRFSPHVKDHANIAKTITTRAGGRMDDNFIMETPSLDCDTFTFNKENVSKIVECAHEFRIRKLTPLECWRLMGFEDTDFWKVKNSGISNSQLYKMAGNSIVVNVLKAIFRELLKVEIRNK